MIQRVSLLIWVLMLAALLLGLLSPSHVYYEGPRSSHFNGRQFDHSLYNSRPSMRRVLAWQLRRSPGVWPSKSNLSRRDVPPLRYIDDDIRVTLVGHSTVLLQFEGINVLTDPVLDGQISMIPYLWQPRSVRPPGIEFDDLPPIDLVLISHDHPDHLDLASLERLWLRDQPRVLTPLGVDRLIQRHLPQVEAKRFDWWQSHSWEADDDDALDGLAATLVPARHWSGRGLLDHNRTLWGGWVLQTRRGSIYFAGDSGYAPELNQQLARQFAPMRLALLPIGGSQPAWLMEPQNMSPQQAVASHLQLGSYRALAIHHGSFALTDEAFREPERSLQSALKAAGVDSEVFLAPAPGQMVKIP